VLDGQPALADKVELLLGLEVLDDDVFQEPVGFAALACVVVPDVEIAQVAQVAFKMERKYN